MDCRITSLVDHRTSLPVVSSLDRLTRINMRSNEANMGETNRPTVHLAVHCHHAVILYFGSTVSQTHLRTTECHRNHTQLAARRLTTKHVRMSTSELFRLLMLRRHIRNHNRSRNRLMYQWLNLHVPTCPSHSLNQKAPPTLTSTIRKSHGEQDRRESVLWPTEHSSLLQNLRPTQPQSLNLSLYHHLHLNLHLNLYTNKKYNTQILHLHMAKVKPMRGNPKLSTRRL